MFRGLYTALVTPFGPNGSGIQTDILCQLIERQIEAGIDGIIFGGSTGEGQVLEQSETQELLQTALRYKGKIQILGACGSSGTSQTSERYKALSQMGVDGVLISTPPYNKPPQRGLLAHFEKIAASAATPIMVYNIPGRTSVNLLPATVKELWKIPQIKSIKESSGSIEQMQTILNDLPAEKSLLCGDDPLSLSVWAIGGAGTVSVLTNVAPQPVVKMWKTFKAGQVLEAAKIQKQLTRLTNLLFVEPNPIPAKFAVGRLIKADLAPRLPLVPLDPAHQNAILSELEKL